MWKDIFQRVRDGKLRRTENNVTENRVSEPFKLGGSNTINLRVDVKGLEDSTKLAIKFEQSQDGQNFYEVGTFPVPGHYHGILVPIFDDWIRYELIVEGDNPNLTVELGF